MAEALKTFSFPVGGIADFYLEDHEKEALYKEKAQENFGSDGLGAIQDVAVRMASYGRYGDDKLVHAETGELVVPRALIEKNPKLKDSIFNHLKDMGIENPERYVVGTEANSINPDTGLPEFFLKDIFDKVGDVIRKVAKPVLTIAGAAFGPYGAALGAGIGGLIQGESAEQALFSGLTAGAGSALFSGFAPGEGTFLGKVGSSLTTNPLDYARNVTAPLLGQGGKELPFIGDTAQTPGLPGAGTTTLGEAFKSGKDFLMGTGGAEPPSFLRKYGPLAAIAATAGGFFERPEMEEFDDPETGADLIEKNRGKYIVENTDVIGAQGPFLIPSKFPFTPSPPVQYVANGGQIVQDDRSAPFSYPREFQNIIPPREDLDQREPILFDEEPKRGVPLRGMPIEQILDPNTFIFGTNDRDEKIEILKKMGRIQTAANGGEAGGTKEFPRRTGGIGMDEGVKGKDSVRAMLMPGEFVMTTDAVNGAGNGDNEKGIKNMYAMMRSFEAKARA